MRFALLLPMASLALAGWAQPVGKVALCAATEEKAIRAFCDQIHPLRFEYGLYDESAIASWKADLEKHARDRSSLVLDAKTAAELAKGPKFLDFERGRSKASEFARAILDGRPLLLLACPPSVYRAADVFSFVKDLPTVWDETRTLGTGVVAKRSGRDWYVAATGLRQPLELDIGFVGRARSRMTAFGADRVERLVASFEKVVLTPSPDGAVAARLVPPVALFFIGDSTLSPRRDYKPNGSWGDALKPALADDVRIVNCAVGGRSTKSFRGLGHWKETVAPYLREGDWALFQFATNDSVKDQPYRSCTPAEYADNLRNYVAEVRAVGAKPVFASCLAHRIWTADRKFPSTFLLQTYTDAMAGVAKELDVPYVDMTALTLKAVRDAGFEGSKQLFVYATNGKDNIHPSKLGAKVFADLFLDELARQPSNPVNALFRKTRIRFTPETTAVVVPKDAKSRHRLVQFAAEEMTNFLSRAFGAAVPIVHEVDPRMSCIVLGSNDWSVAVGLDVSELPQEGFAIRTRENAVYVAGVDANRNPRLSHGYYARATLFGVYDFLERFVGCRFYFPGEVGEYVPRTTAFVVPETDLTSAPRFLERSISSLVSMGRWPETMTNAGEACWTESLRLRLQTRPLPHCHGLRGFKFVQRFGATHPEYFQMKKDGTRDLRDTGKEPHYLNNKLCYSSKGLLEEMYQDVKAYLTGQPAGSRGIPRWGWGFAYGEYVDVMPEDGTVHCCCDLCKAAYAKAKDPKNESNELVWNYTIDIAERLKREGVKGNVMQMAYSSYHNVPDRKIPDNVVVTVCNNGAWVLPERGERDFASMKAWFDNVGRIKVYSNCGKHRCLNLNIPDVPSVTPWAMAAFYNRIAPMTRGAHCSNETDRFIYSMLNYYVYSKVAWEGSVDADALMDEFFRLMFGAGAEQMKEIFAAFERKWMTEILGNSIDTAIGTVTAAPSEFKIWTDLYSSDRLKPIRDLADRAEAAVTAGSPEAMRLAFFRREMLEPTFARAAGYADDLSVEKEKARRAAQPKPSLVKDFRPVTITATADMTNKPFHAVKFAVAPKPGRRYRISYFVKGENIVPTARRGGAQAVAWRNEKTDSGRAVPDVGFEGSFDWMHHSETFVWPKKDFEAMRPEIDLRLFFATGTAMFDGLTVEEIGD